MDKTEKRIADVGAFMRAAYGLNVGAEMEARARRLMRQAAEEAVEELLGGTKQRQALGAVAPGPRSVLQDDPRAHELEAEVRKLEAAIRVQENEERRSEGVREEREAVVRWLRGLRSDEETLGLADSIEAGEHRKEA